MNIAKFFAQFVIISLLLINTQVLGESEAPPKTAIVKLKGKAFHAMLAINNQQRVHGLSGYPQLSSDQAMLFIYPNSGQYLFWMPQMLFPLDILWFDAQKKLIHIEKNLPPCPKIGRCPLYGPQGLSQYILEVPAGTSDRLLLQKGDELMLPADLFEKDRVD